MAHHQLGNSDLAQKWFDMAALRAEEEISGMPTWNRRLTLELLQEEAAQLLSISH
jgi:hypothetical protein